VLVGVIRNLARVDDAGDGCLARQLDDALVAGFELQLEFGNAFPMKTGSRSAASKRNQEKAANL